MDEFLQNFYIIKRGDFFIILLMQQISFGFLSALNQLGMLYSFFFSPSVFLRVHGKGREEQPFFKRESLTYEYGYHYALSLTILGIILVFW